MPPTTSSLCCDQYASGVGTMPISTTSRPAASRPLMSARWRLSPLGRLSRPTDTAPFTPLSARNAAYAPATAVATSSVRSFPATPRMSYSRKIARDIANELSVAVERHVPAHRRRAALGEGHDRVGKKPEDEDDGCRPPNHRAGPAAGSFGQNGRGRARFHEHHHHDVEIISRADDAGDDEDYGEPGLWEWRLERCLEHVPLGEETDTAEDREA